MGAEALEIILYPRDATCAVVAVSHKAFEMKRMKKSTYITFKA